MYTSRSTFLSETIFILLLFEYILRDCEQILLSESLEEDFSGFDFFSFPFDGVIFLLEVDRLDDEDDDDDEILESDDGGSSGKPVENYLVVFSESSESESIPSSLSGYFPYCYFVRDHT